MEPLYFFADFFIYHESYTNETEWWFECVRSGSTLPGSKIVFKLFLLSIARNYFILDFRNLYRYFINTTWN